MGYEDQPDEHRWLLAEDFDSPELIRSYWEHKAQRKRTRRRAQPSLPRAAPMKHKMGGRSSPKPKAQAEAVEGNDFGQSSTPQQGTRTRAIRRPLKLDL